jgi:hypothetical protein
MSADGRQPSDKPRSRVLVALALVAVTFVLVLMAVRSHVRDAAAPGGSASASSAALFPALAELQVRTMSSGEPAAGSTVHLESVAGQQLLRVERSDTDGWTAFSGLPAGRYRVTAKHPSQGTGTAEPVLASGARDTVTLVLVAPTAAENEQRRQGLPDKAGVSGRVVSSNGEPVANAQVGLSGGSQPQFTSTDEDGQFEFRHLDTGTVNLFATASGLAAAHARGVNAGSSDVLLILDAPARVSGGIVYARRPAILYVRLCHHDAEFNREVCLKSRYYSPPENSFELEGLPSGSFELVFVSEERELGRLPLTLNAGDTLKLASVHLR